MNCKRNIYFGIFFSILVTGIVNAAGYPLVDAVEFRPRQGLGNFFEKLGDKKELKIAYLGGSITAQPGWRVKSRQWFQQQYPQAKIQEINAAIGGTGSDLGAYRLGHDVLDHKPDLLFVEFAVNDGGAQPQSIHRTMEGIVRQTWNRDPQIDICFVYTLTAGMAKDLQNGKFPRAASAMEAVAEHYGIPSIHMGLEVAMLQQKGKLIFTATKPITDDEKLAASDKIIFSPDGVHPYTDSGHQLYLEAIVRSMNQISKAKIPAPHKLKHPLTPDNWQNATMIPLSDKYLSSGWTKLDPQKDPIAKSFANRLPLMFKANKPGETIQFKFKGTALEIYDILGPDCGQIIVHLDDQPARIVPRFDAYCVYHRLAKLTVAHDLTDTVHNVKLEIHPDQPDKAKILSKRNEKIDNPKRFDDTAWYAGAILLIGELLE